MERIINLAATYSENELDTAMKRGIAFKAFGHVQLVIAGSKMDKTAGNIFRKTAGMKNPHL
jgi:hypothetical protein